MPLYHASPTFNAQFLTFNTHSPPPPNIYRRLSKYFNRLRPSSYL